MKTRVLATNVESVGQVMWSGIGSRHATAVLEIL